MRAILVATVLLGACAGDTTTVCQRMCRELVQNCDYAAFPDFESCMQGCSYNESQGADVAGQEECVAAAECDTFAIVECEHAYNE